MNINRDTFQSHFEVCKIEENSSRAAFMAIFIVTSTAIQFGGVIPVKGGALGSDHNLNGDHGNSHGHANAPASATNYALDPSHAPVNHSNNLGRRRGHGHLYCVYPSICVQTSSESCLQNFFPCFASS